MSILSIFLFISLFLLNASNKLVICAALVTGAALAVNFMIEFYGKREAIYTLITCTVLCCAFKWQNFNLMILVSYTAILASILSSIIAFEKLRPKFDFHTTNFVTLIMASIIDSTIMYVGLLHKFPAGRCLLIYTRDLIFKFSYVSILSICLFASAYLFCLAKRKHIKFCV